MAENTGNDGGNREQRRNGGNRNYNRNRNRNRDNREGRENKGSQNASNGGQNSQGGQSGEQRNQQGQGQRRLQGGKPYDREQGDREKGQNNRNFKNNNNNRKNRKPREFGNSKEGGREGFRARNTVKAEETAADIKAENERLEKEIWIEIAEIHTIKLD